MKLKEQESCHLKMLKYLIKKHSIGDNTSGEAAPLDAPTVRLAETRRCGGCRGKA
jgi:hypothetical protein